MDINKQDFKDFFPRMHIERGDDGHLQGIEDAANYELLVKKEKILAFLQTLFFEERMVEILVDQGTRRFFGALWDHLPDPGKQDGASDLEEPEEYQEGSYLKEMGHLVLSPLEPVAGNIKVRSSSTILLCFYTGTNAVELGTRFLRADTINGASVLIFEYPSAGRLIRENRPFRAKPPQDYDLITQIWHDGKSETILDCAIMDLSSQGIALENENLINQFNIGDAVNLSIFASIDKDNPLKINATVRHFAKVRTKDGNTNICGVQFDLETRSLATAIERMAASVQRLQLREISEKTAGMRGVRLMK